MITTTNIGINLSLLRCILEMRQKIEKYDHDLKIQYSNIEL